MSRPAGFQPLEEGWAVLTERLAALGVRLDEHDARAIARDVVVDVMQRGHVVDLEQYRRGIAHEVDVACRPLREQLARLSNAPASIGGVRIGDKVVIDGGRMPIGPAGSSTGTRAGDAWSAS